MSIQTWPCQYKLGPDKRHAPLSDTVEAFPTQLSCLKGCLNTQTFKNKLCQFHYAGPFVVGNLGAQWIMSGHFRTASTAPAPLAHYPVITGRKGELITRCQPL